nr:hypothetical protein [Tanacetum cinerariifolium]
MIYDGSVIAKETNVISIADSEKTLMLKEESDLIVLEKKANITPINYAKLNRLSGDFALKNDLRKFKGKDIDDNAAQVSNTTTIAQGMNKLDPVILAPKVKNNREAHEYYLKHTMEQAAILRELIQKLLGYVRDTCPDIYKPRVNPSTSASESKPSSKTKNDRILRTPECSSCGALYTMEYCCSDGSLRDKIICDLNKTPDLSQRPPQNCPKCGNQVNGHYFQGCALLRNKFKEDMFTYCIENGYLQEFQDAFEPSNDNSNVVNALQEPFVVKQDPGENSSQSPPQINHHCCYGCGDSLEDIFFHQCTCELCGKGAHYGYNCPLKVPIVPNPKPFNNQTIYELPQTMASFDPTFYSEDRNSFTYDSTSNLVYDSPNIFNPPLQPPIYSYKFCGNNAYYGHDCSLQVSLHNDVQNIHEELAVYINTLSWDRTTVCCDDDDDDKDCTIAITPILSTEEPDNSLSMRYEHLDTVPATKLNEFIKSSVENLVSIPSESEGIPSNMCDVPFHDNSPPLDISKDQFKDFIDSNDDSTSIDDDSFSINNIKYVEASPPNSELVSLEVMEIVIPKDSFIFDLSINPFPPTDRSDFYEFANELAHIISPPEYDCFCFKNEPNSGDFTMDVVEDFFRQENQEFMCIMLCPPIPPFN